MSDDSGGGCDGDGKGKGKGGRPVICDDDSFHDGRAIATGDDDGDDDGDGRERTKMSRLQAIYRSQDELGNETK